jgi:hypothetical protein
MSHHGDPHSTTTPLVPISVYHSICNTLMGTISIVWILWASRVNIRVRDCSWLEHSAICTQRIVVGLWRWKHTLQVQVANRQWEQLPFVLCHLYCTVCIVQLTSAMLTIWFFAADYRYYCSGLCVTYIIHGQYMVHNGLPCTQPWLNAQVGCDCPQEQKYCLPTCMKIPNFPLKRQAWGPETWHTPQL